MMGSTIPACAARRAGYERGGVGGMGRVSGICWFEGRVGRERVV